MYETICSNNIHACIDSTNTHARITYNNSDNNNNECRFRGVFVHGTRCCFLTVPATQFHGSPVHRFHGVVPW